MNTHKPSLKAWWVGRGGRSPALTADLATLYGLSLNGAAPVKIFV
jgi:hypothetical protein